jgi:hypothetical protein
MKTLVHKFIQHELDGNIFLGLMKISPDDDSLGIHYINFIPGCDIDACCATAVTSLGDYSAVPTDSINQVKTLAQSLWTDAVIAAYQASQQELITSNRTHSINNKE